MSGGTWTFTKLYTFQATSSTDGSGPSGTLIFDHAGNLYGTTKSGGTSNDGTVFELSPPSVSGGAWTETILHSFSFTDGFVPSAGLYMDGAGNLYGTTVYGGSTTGLECSEAGCGVVFKLSPGSGGAWTEQLLHRFDYTDGENPYGALTFYHGNFYGTAYAGGANHLGTVFELTPGHGGPWTFTTIHTFGSGADGSNPYSGVIFDSHGNLYGTTFGGGDGGVPAGSAYKLSLPSGSSTWSETVLMSFSDTNDEYYVSGPMGGLLLRSGKLYGTTSGCFQEFNFGCSISGTVFSITNF